MIDIYKYVFEGYYFLNKHETIKPTLDLTQFEGLINEGGIEFVIKVKKNNSDVRVRILIIDLDEEFNLIRLNY